MSMKYAERRGVEVAHVCDGRVIAVVGGLLCIVCPVRRVLFVSLRYAFKSIGRDG